MTARSFAAIAGRQLRTTTGKVDARKKLIGAVRAAASRLHLSDEDRRAIQLEMTGKASMSDMTPAEIGRVLDRLNRDRPAPMAHRAHVGKVRALWWTLYWLGEIDEPNDQALDAFVRRQTGISSLRFLNHSKAPAVIEALKAMTARADVRWPTEAEVNAIPIMDGKMVTMADVERMRVITAIWARIRDRGEANHPVWHGFAAAALGVKTNPYAWSSRELDTVIRIVGKKLRRLMQKQSID